MAGAVLRCAVAGARVGVVGELFVAAIGVGVVELALSVVGGRGCCLVEGGEFALLGVLVVAQLFCLLARSLLVGDLLRWWGCE